MKIGVSRKVDDCDIVSQSQIEGFDDITSNWCNSYRLSATKRMDGPSIMENSGTIARL